MAVYRPDIPPEVADIIRHLPPQLKRDVKQALRIVSEDPFAGIPLIRELAGLWRIRVKRFRIIYEPDNKSLVIRVFAIGHRREIYEEAADRLRRRRGNRSQE